MWRSVAPLLARDPAVVCADLRGYGRSGCPPSAPEHAPFSKRAMAQDMVRFGRTGSGTNSGGFSGEHLPERGVGPLHQRGKVLIAVALRFKDYHAKVES